MRTITLSVAAAALLVLAGCSSKSPAPSVAAPVAAPSSASATAAGSTAAGSTTGTSTTAAAPAGGSGRLTLDLVKQQVEPVFAKDPDCPKGAWVTDPGNIDEKYRAGVTAFGEYDWHLRDGETVPHRVAQAVFLTFKDPSALLAYDNGELGGMTLSLQDGSTVVVIGSGLATVQPRTVLRAIEQACQCGHVT